MALREIDYSELDEGVREIVRELRRLMLRTVDSGDGSKFGTMAGALPYPHVVIQSDRLTWFNDASVTAGALGPGWQVEMNGSPGGPFMIVASKHGDDEMDRINTDYDRANKAEAELSEARQTISVLRSAIGESRGWMDKASEAYCILDEALEEVGS